MIEESRGPSVASDQKWIKGIHTPVNKEKDTYMHGFRTEYVREYTHEYTVNTQENIIIHTQLVTMQIRYIILSICHTHTHVLKATTTAIKATTP